jgi:uncharacterized protein YijF (DUF1287 family)
MAMAKSNPMIQALGAIGLVLSVGPLVVSGCKPHSSRSPLIQSSRRNHRSKRSLAIAASIVEGAQAEAQRGVLYDASYRQMAYPGGDVRIDRGACTDVVIRALRHAGYDLQRLIHEDMKRHFDEYPHRYGLHGPDPNIDHRRVPNQITFLRRHGLELPRSTTGPAAATWEPGDLVYWRLPNGVGHCGVLSDARDDQGLPLVIHNLAQARQEDCLTEWEIIEHFRYPVDQ